MEGVRNLVAGGDLVACTKTDILVTLDGGVECELTLSLGGT